MPTQNIWIREKVNRGEAQSMSEMGGG